MKLQRFLLETPGKIHSWINIGELLDYDLAAVHCDMLAAELGRPVRVISDHDWQVKYLNDPTQLVGVVA